MTSILPRRVCLSSSFAISVACFMGAAVRAAPPEDVGQPDWLVTAKAIAARDNLSVGEAIRRIRLEQKAADRAEELAADPEYAGSFIERGAKGIKVKFGFKSGKPRSLGSAVPDAELAADSEVVALTYSLNELAAEQKRMHPLLRQQGIKASSGIVQSENTLYIYTGEAAKLNGLIASGAINVAPFVKISNVSFTSGTEAAVTGGRSMGSSSGTCTTGFVVAASADGKRGISTAGHCATDLMIMTNPSNLTGAFSPGPIQRDLYNNVVDARWYRNTADTYTNTIVTGGATISITSIIGKSLVTPGNTTICLGKRLGTTQCTNVADNNFMEPLPDGTTRGPVYRMTTHIGEPGDSGGPWYNGSKAYGLHRGFVQNSGTGVKYSTITPAERLADIGVAVLTVK